MVFVTASRSAGVAMVTQLVVKTQRKVLAMRLLSRCGKGKQLVQGRLQHALVLSFLLIRINKVACLLL